MISSCKHRDGVNVFVGSQCPRDTSSSSSIFNPEQADTRSNIESCREHGHDCLVMYVGSECPVCKRIASLSRTWVDLT